MWAGGPAGLVSDGASEQVGGIRVVITTEGDEEKSRVVGEGGKEEANVAGERREAVWSHLGASGTASDTLL